ncbi:MAG: hypothetical protein JW768_13165 [Chitinispirillaceae bacterium]|nr:hypothetical protein [Chitinispirillaceae bacterium]
MQKKLYRNLIIAAGIGLAADAYAAVGQSAVITLVFPYGARSYAMGEVGTALADDGSAPRPQPRRRPPVDDKFRL